MKFEELPGEILFHILSYLKPLDVFYAFHNLINSRLQSIVVDMYSIRSDEDNYSSNLNISLVDIPLFMFDFALSNVISFYSNMIYSLTLSNKRTPGQIDCFLEKYSFKYDFTYLKTLILIEPTNSELKEILPNLPNIQTLSIRSKHMYLFDSQLIQQILYFKRTLTNCFLSQFEFDYISHQSRSSIRKLHLQSCDYSCFIHILHSFLCLESLEIDFLSISSSQIFLSDQIISLKQLKFETSSISWSNLQLIFPLLNNLERFSLGIASDDSYDHINSSQWQMIIHNYWPMLKTFEINCKILHLTSTDINEVYPRLLAFKNDIFWRKRKIDFQIDIYQDKTSLNIMFYSIPYSDRKYSNHWGYPIDRTCLMHSNSYRYVYHLLLTIYNTKQMRNDLEKVSHYFSAIDTLTIRFQQHVSNHLFEMYVKKFLNLNSIKHLILNDKCVNIAILYELMRNLPNVTKLTISNNHRIIIKQMFQNRNAFLLNLLTKKIIDLHLLYDGVIHYETVEAIRSNFTFLRSFTACLAHFEDFRDVIPTFIRHIKSLRYLHIGLECDNDKKNFFTQDMYAWFRRHQVTQQIKLHIDCDTNSIHIWL